MAVHAPPWQSRGVDDDDDGGNGNGNGNGNATPGGPLHSLPISPWKSNLVHGDKQQSVAVHDSRLLKIVFSYWWLISTYD